jgi:SAM-dependent methyltransferase
VHRFTCNICGSPCLAEALDREIPSCKCGSNVRFRWIVHAVSTHFFGKSLSLRQFPRAKQIRGLGLSDALLFSKHFSQRFSYENTCYDREPRFDITAPPSGMPYDFVIASEVFEHIAPPVQAALDNLARLLKPDGVVFFSSPWESTGQTEEHFPNLHDWQLVKLRSGSMLVNRALDGHVETFENLAFHGGPGATLEMRVFSRDGLLHNCQAAGLDVEFADDEPAVGVVWEPWSRGMILRPSAP